MNIHICFSSDDNYACHMGASICSILAHAKKSDHYHFHILDGGISEKNQAHLLSLAGEQVAFSFIPVSADDFKDCPMTNYVSYISRSTYYRFRIPSYLPEVDKVLYLDCDVIANHDVAELYGTELEQASLAAVPEVFQQDHTQRLEYQPDEWYCNAGVLLINNRKWREENIEEKLFAYATEPSHPIIYQDQDIINEVLKYNIRYLPLHWNLQHDAIFSEDSYPFHEEQRKEALESPRLIHYTNHLKPWTPECCNPWAYLYLDALKASPWKEAYARLRGRIIRFRLLRAIWCKESNVDGTVKRWRFCGVTLLKKRRKQFCKETTLMGIKFRRSFKVADALRRSQMLEERLSLREKELVALRVELREMESSLRTQLAAHERQYAASEKRFHDIIPENISLISNQALLIELWLDEFYHKNIEHKFDFSSIARDTKTLLLSCWTATPGCMFDNLASLFGAEKFLFSYKEDNATADCYCIWGTQPYSGLLETIKKAVFSNRPLLICEGGFISCVETSACKREMTLYNQTLSFIIDDLSPYYDARKRNRLEDMLNDSSLVIEDAELERAERVIRNIIDNHVTKYNNQPIFKPQLGRPGRQKVLVVDQTYGDMSIAKGKASDATFSQMLEAAIMENPDADIIVKTHPDTIAGHRGYYSGLTASERLYPYTEPINPISLIKAVDKVYVCTSQFGFEAALCGKEVHVFGLPFYAGWGVTIDRQHEPRRTATRTLQEIFYIAYILYTKYVSPNTHRECEIEEAIEYILELREQFFKERGMLTDEL